MNLPNEVPHGLPVSDLTQAVNQLIRYVRSITPRPSATVSVNTLSNGTTFAVRHAAGGVAAVRGGGGRFGFKVTINGADELCAETGTAQVFGGEVKVYEAGVIASDISESEGGFVYAVCDISADPPEWEAALRYDDMTGQAPDDELWVPIAQVTMEEGEEGASFPKITQLHWGNIVVPAVANAVDIQAELAANDEEPEEEEE